MLHRGRQRVSPLFGISPGKPRIRCRPNRNGLRWGLVGLAAIDRKPRLRLAAGVGKKEMRRINHPGPFKRISKRGKANSKPFGYEFKADPFGFGA